MLRAVRAGLPAAPLVYCADTAGFPYGSKSEAHVSARVAGLLGRLAERLSPSLIVIACNTASTIALQFVRPVIAVPIVGTVPAIKPAAERSRTRVIGVLGTEATVRQPYVDDLFARFARDCVVLRHGSGPLVEAAEAALRGIEPDPAIFRDAVEGLTRQPQGDRLDTIVLACTHFPLVTDRLAAAAPPGLAFVDGAAGIARRVAHLAQGLSWPADPRHRFLVTGPLEQVAALRATLHGEGFPEPERL